MNQNEYLKHILDVQPGHIPQWHGRCEGADAYRKAFRKPLILPTDENVFARTILPGEFIFEIDPEPDGNTEWKGVREHGRQVCELLQKAGVPHIDGSSGRGVHIHVFVDRFTLIPREVIDAFFQDVEQYSTEDVAKLGQKLKAGFLEHFNELLAETAGAKIDIHCGHSPGRVIKEFGTLNEKTGYVKTAILNHVWPQERPKDQVYPPKIETWKPSDAFMLMVYRRFVHSERCTKPAEPIALGTKIEWIESLLDSQIPDGRHIVVLNIFVPYLQNILDEGPARLGRWLNKQDPPASSELRDYAARVWRNGARSTKRWTPMLKREKIRKRFKDVPEVLKAINLCQEKQLRNLIK